MKYVKLSELVPDPTQPRQVFDPKTMELLEKSVSEKGILVPLIVEKTKNGKLLVIDGERRYRTACKLKLAEVPVEILEPMGAKERMIMRFHLQDQHASWTPFDRARAIAFFQQSEGLSIQDTADLLGVSRDTVYMWVSILRLSSRSQDYAVSKRLPFSYLEKIANITKTLVEATQEPAEQIELSLLEKLDKKEIGNNDGFTMLKRLLSKGEDPKKIVKFVYSRNSVKALLMDSETGNEVELDTLLYRASALKYSLSKALKEKLNKGMTQLQAEKLIELRKVIENFIK
jgi:ParB/RepB/Spo0J family partition protein